MNQKSTRDKKTRGEAFRTFLQYTAVWVKTRGTLGRQRRPDSGKTHCNWVSPRLQLYLLELAGAGLEISPAPDSAGKYSTIKGEKGTKVLLSGPEAN